MSRHRLYDCLILSCSFANKTRALGPTLHLRPTVTFHQLASSIWFWFCRHNRCVVHSSTLVRWLNTAHNTIFIMPSSFRHSECLSACPSQIWCYSLMFAASLIGLKREMLLHLIACARITDHLEKQLYTRYPHVRPPHGYDTLSYLGNELRGTLWRPIKD